MALTIYDYEFKFIDSPIFYEKLRELGFLLDLGDKLTFRLPDTDYYIFLTISSFVWVYYPEGSEPELISLEEILERLPGDKVNDILFHLDIFRQEKNRKAN